MFFIKDLSLNITLHPSYFGPRMKQFLKSKLLQEVEGSCTGKFGYILCVLDYDKIEIERGRILPTDGSAEFTVKYRAVVFKPFKGEVVDGTVVSCSQHGFEVQVGPMKVFVTKHLMPQDLQFNAGSNPPSYQNSEDVITIKSRIRVKIEGCISQVSSIHAIGSIKEDYLGAI
ncbi:similar to Saccharomyces cerevisiae YDR404C RPB7 RNA polymerase II subunit B16 [Maudiozyma barnettii]|uniref:DNA-directed RNA polymerase subunit n=2 Tax=Maudiozyma TaxID=3162980 RepID=A0A1X7R1U5_9SACH|nr:DNA-directed RNA polymerase II subunit RPB7 [Kazachstania barnettii]CAB4253719.1 similar to Saccharomyces cerevisiae YDR404C RPB7 RNA polymerase II subunit B16 [Kazachstania barnettii]CAD1781467.1 similar to Saccharomyces cerevisiae YDR404C RPB7 RNA polymerase II subunit B16 [Kazachstania barnettii]SMN19637.1 similar to Saccharomyces cerevisiae YDR404C RPB7 RNA polymerase II subunit B16 [Kazachstania saulgeensis]